MSIKLETMKVLTEEQRMIMLAKKGHHQGQGKGQGQGKRMHRQHQNCI
jgi:hypothetical protein